MTLSFRLRGPIGPPYMTSRHKRNHHEKFHHHQQQHHRHNAPSFRSSNEDVDEMWRLEGRHFMVRHRRSVEEVNDDDGGDGATKELESLRIKRQNQGCTIDYNSYRRLKIGCTRQEVIDVNPSCSDEGEEGKWLITFNFWI